MPVWYWQLKVTPRFTPARTGAAGPLCNAPASTSCPPQGIGNAAPNFPVVCWGLLLLSVVLGTWRSTNLQHAVLRLCSSTGGVGVPTNTAAGHLFDADASRNFTALASNKLYNFAFVCPMHRRLCGFGMLNGLPFLRPRPSTPPSWIPHATGSASLACLSCLSSCVARSSSHCKPASRRVALWQRGNRPAFHRCGSQEGRSPASVAFLARRHRHGHAHAHTMRARGRGMNTPPFRLRVVASRTGAIERTRATRFQRIATHTVTRWVSVCVHTAGDMRRTPRVHGTLPRGHRQWQERTRTSQSSCALHLKDVDFISGLFFGFISSIGYSRALCHTLAR